MLFHTVQFFVFLAVTITLHYALPRPARKYLLLAASYVFYMAWNPVFVALLLTLTAIDYAAALWMERVTAAPRRKAFLLLSLAANLGFLGFFKYYNFLAGMVAQALGRPADSFALSILLPLGISFHTFQSISYVIDVYRGQQRAIRNPVDYALFIAFFPQLVAGPIVRAHEFFADFYHWRRPQPEEVLRGTLWIVFGLVKKVAFADQFAQIADAYFGNLAQHAGPAAAWSGTFAFAMQIFFDFSGYTDMAIGMALLLGFHFPVNFRRPYLAASITDFWRRWHISLSRWLRDYLYIPLGGNRRGTWRTYRNLMLTMLLGGLWHGASWNFVIWGGYHGLLLSIERMLGRALGVALTFPAVLVGWVFFRAATLRDSAYVLGQMFSGGWSAAGNLMPAWLMAAAILALLIALLEEKWELLERCARGPAWAYAGLLVLLLFSAELIGATDQARPFVYFQF